MCMGSAPSVKPQKAPPPSPAPPEAPEAPRVGKEDRTGRARKGRNDLRIDLAGGPRQRQSGLNV